MSSRQYDEFRVDIKYGTLFAIFAKGMCEGKTHLSQQRECFRRKNSAAPPSRRFSKRYENLAVKFSKMLQTRSTVFKMIYNEAPEERQVQKLLIALDCDCCN